MNLKYLVRFFKQNAPECFIEFEYSTPPPIPHLGEEVSFEYADEDDYSCFIVSNVNYNYPQLDEDKNPIDDYVVIDITVKKEMLE